jgi:hypothetical protein
MNTYYEQRFCDDCMCTHFIEVTATNREICHGHDYLPRETPTQYVKRSGRGFQVIEKYHPANTLPIDWQLAANEHDAREEAKLNEWLDLGI